MFVDMLIGQNDKYDMFDAILTVSHFFFAIGSDVSFIKSTEIMELYAVYDNA